MPVTINDTVVMGDDGKFTEDFSSSLLGDDYKDSKVFETTPDLQSLLKSHADTKSALGKQKEEILSNAIQKPREGASDQERVDYRKVLQKELGAPEKPEDYEFPRLEGAPDGLSHSEDTEKVFRQVFFEEGIPVDVVKSIVDKFNKFQLAQFNARLEAEKVELEDAVKSLKNDWKGDNLVVNARLAHTAIKEFATEDLTRLINESKIYDDAGNLEKWNSLGFDPGQLRIWAKIGEKMKLAAPPADETTEETKKKDKGVLGVYDHPTSKRMTTRT